MMIILRWVETLVVFGGVIVAIHAQMAEAHFELKSDVWEGSTQRANQAKPTQQVKAPTARIWRLVAKGMTRAKLNFFEMAKPTSR